MALVLPTDSGELTTPAGHAWDAGGKFFASERMAMGSGEWEGGRGGGGGGTWKRGRGGGVGMYVQQDSTVNTTIQSCRFEGNYATTFGGGVYIILDGGLMNHSLVITSSEFVDNESGDGGGGLNIGFLYFRYTVPSVSIMKCYFANNQATYGGGAYVYPGIGVGNGYTVVFKNCTFVRNRAEKYGAALGLISLDFFDPQSEYAPYNIHNW